MRREKSVLQHHRILFAMLTLAALFQPGASSAQSPDGAWSAPVNLSRSGAADQPRIAAGTGSALRAFWWDRFDGVTTARYDGEDWGSAAAAPLDASAMPTIVEDGRGWAHAFWLGEASRDTGIRALMHSQMAVGGRTWSSPQMVAESAVAFAVATSPGGGIALAYVRTLHDSAFPAGVYLRRNAGGGASWGAAVGVYKTIYFRLLTADDAHVRVADAGNGVLHLVWDDPRLREALYARSTDNGASWSAPETLGEPDQLPARPRVFALADGGALRLWEAAGMGACVLYQQRLTTTGVSAGAWSAPERVFQGLNACPQGERSWIQDGGLLWVWGEGTGGLTLAGWDSDRGRWSEPRSVGFRFEDAESGNWVGLGDLHATLSGDELAVAGSDAVSGEVWVTVGQVNALELAFAPPSPWSGLERLSTERQAAWWPAVTVDAEGSVHLVWSESASGSEPATTLSYIRWDATSERWSRTVMLQEATSGAEMARQPSLVADGDGLLHLVWSSGEQGQVAYSRAKVREAASSGGWSIPTSLSAADLSGSWPQIDTDAAGRVYAIYAVPLNEGRGIYLVRSEDGGDSWTEPIEVFDAAAAGWAMVTHPALLVAPDGALHAAWVRASLPGTWPPQGIVYACSEDGGDTWTEPQDVASAGYDWPQLAMAGGRVHLLYASTGGGLWHRISGDGQVANGNGWSTPARVHGWESVAGPFGVAVTGPLDDGTLHLAGVDAKQGALLYGAWDGEAWSAAEAFSLGPEALTGLCAAVDAPQQGGRLAVALLATADGDGNALPAVFGMARAIPTVERALLPTPMPTSTPVVTPTATPSPTAAPSPTPNLNTPVISTPFVDPLLLGAGLAVVIVAGVLTAWGMRRQRGRV